MTTTDFVAAVYLRSTGKVTAITAGSTKWQKIENLANFFLVALTQEPDVDWSFFYNPALSIGTVTNTDTFAIDKTVTYKVSDKPGDCIRIIHTNGIDYTDYDMVPHDDLKMLYGADKTKSYNGYYCAIIGSNLVFNHKFISTDPQYGGTVYLPCYTIPTTIGDSSTILPELTTYLPVRVAAEYVRNDITLSQNYPLLLAESNQALQRLKDDNDAQQDQIYRTQIVRGAIW